MVAAGKRLRFSLKLLACVQFSFHFRFPFGSVMRTSMYQNELSQDSLLITLPVVGASYFISYTFLKGSWQWEVSIGPSVSNTNLEMLSKFFKLQNHSHCSIQCRNIKLPVKKNQQVFLITKWFFVLTNKMSRTEFCLDKLSSKIARKICLFMSEYFNV